MAIIKCKMCGGNIEISADKTYGTCDSCGSTMTFPKVSDEQRVNLFNRANHFRRQNEFDKAIAAYERILDEDNRDAEAHWGVVLSRYGIEYVEDPVSHERIPTCHRVQMNSILTDPDYLAAKENAPDYYSAELYEKEAKQIAEIQKGILAISAQEDPYDVFICYKESTDGGSRTKDSTIAQDIYYQLTTEGYKVFFSRITLEDKLGKQYEPYIFAALNSAKVMLVIGTKPEYLNAVWVKNEWSRFLALMKQDRSKLLIPCYRDMDPYDLPEELSALQSQDMSKIGFMQDLLRGIKKLTQKDEPAPTVQVVQTVSGNATVDSLMRRAELFMEDGDFNSANEYLDKVLDIDPEHAAAYMGKVQAALRLKNIRQIEQTLEAFEELSDWTKALRFASPEQKKCYQSYLNASLSARENDRMSMVYSKAATQLKSAEDVEACEAAAKLFESIRAFKDAETQIQACRTKAHDILQKAYNAAVGGIQLAKTPRDFLQLEDDFKKLSGFLDSEAKAAEMHANADKLNEKEAANRKKRTKIRVCLAFLACVIIAAVFVTVNYVIPSHKYQQALQLQMQGAYEKAINAYTALDGYSDSAAQIQVCWYAIGEMSEAQRDYSEAAYAFENAGDFSDGQLRSNVCWYEEGKKLAEEERWSEAASAFGKADRYSDTHQRLISVYQHLNTGLFFQEDITLNVYGLRADGTVLATGDKEYGNDEGQRNVWSFKDISRLILPVWDTTVGLTNSGTLVATGRSSERFDGIEAKGFSDVENIFTYYDDAGTSFVGLKKDGTIAAAGSIEESVRNWSNVECLLKDRNGTLFALTTDGKVKFLSDRDHGYASVQDWDDIQSVVVECESYNDVVFGLTKTGTVVIAGNDSEDFAEVTTWTDIKQLAYANRSGGVLVGLKIDGTVLIAGNNLETYNRILSWENIEAVYCHNCAVWGLKDDGSVVAVFDPKTIYNYRLNDIRQWSDIAALEFHDRAVIGYKRDGGVVIADCNYDGEYENKGEWTTDEGIVDLAINGSIALGLRNDGTVIYADLGTGTLDYYAEEKNQEPVSEWSDIVKIYVYGESAFGIKADGSVVATGQDVYLDDINVTTWKLW